MSAQGIAQRYTQYLQALMHVVFRWAMPIADVYTPSGKYHYLNFWNPERVPYVSAGHRPAICE